MCLILEAKLGEALWGFHSFFWPFQKTKQNKTKNISTLSATKEVVIVKIKERLEDEGLSL